jgi:NAD-dependent SIR2 family protein deacetylase
MFDYLFILGAGASVDSGLKTFRGCNGIYGDNVYEYPPNNIEQIFQDIVEASKSIELGPTYQLLKTFKNSFIITQNIDRLALRLEIPTIELHKRKDGSIVQLGEELDEQVEKEITELIHFNKFKYCVVVGSSIPFKYLRTWIISTVGKKGAKIIHINPDNNYFHNVETAKGELWFEMSAYEGLLALMDDKSVSFN